MIGVPGRVPHVVCEVGTCFVEAVFTEHITVIPGSPDLRHERHQIDIALCRQHDADFEESGLVGTITAYGDEIAERTS